MSKKPKSPTVTISDCVINGPSIPDYKTALEAVARAIEANARAAEKLASAVVGGPPSTSIGIMIGSNSEPKDE